MEDIEFQVKHQEPRPRRWLDGKEEYPLWDRFSGGEIDEVGEYTKPTPEQEENFKKRNERMSEIFEGADFQWYLDGAVNISLYEDNQIREHKDLDMSVFREDAAKLEDLLSRQGFGIFVGYEESGKKLMRRMTTEELATFNEVYLLICKVDSNGKIQRETPDPFNFVDLHIHSKDAKGDTIIGYSGTILPKEFFVPIKKELANGKSINLSQPAVVAYHKLHSDRPYDPTDLQRLAPHLQEKDFAMLRETLEEEIARAEKEMKEKLREVWNVLSSILKTSRDQKAISEKLWTHPDLEMRRSDPEVSDYISLISQYLSEKPGISFGDFLVRSLSILKPRESGERKIRVINELEKLRGQKATN